MKKLLLASVALVLMFALVACQGGAINSETKITDTNGAGSRTISVKILKDGATKFDGTATVTKNGKHLPNGPEAIVNKLKEVCALEDATIEISESTDEYDIVSISYEFSSIDEYNEKTETLANGVAEVTPAELTVDGDKVTFTESTANFQNSIQWAIDAVYDDPEVYDPKAGDPAASPVEKASMAELYDMIVVVGDATGKVDFDEARANEADVEETITVTGTVSAASEEPVDEEPADTEEPAEETPATADNGIIIFVSMMIIAGAALVVARKRALN